MIDPEIEELTLDDMAPSSEDDGDVKAVGRAASKQPKEEGENSEEVKEIPSKE